MGSRHNRKRTRSRPRNRKNLYPNAAGPQLLTFTSPFALHQPFVPSQYIDAHTAKTLQHGLFPAATAQGNSQTAQDLLRRQRMLLSQRHEAAMEAERLRMFGGVEGDPVSLCGPMLRVVMELFEGNVDYVDP